jgi:hypothetical protein
MKTPRRTLGTPPTGAGGASTSKRGKGQHDHYAYMPSLSGGSSKLVASSTEQVGSWSAVLEVPDYEVNSLAAPIGEFWDHMRMYAFNQACREFPWHLNWNQQCPELKAG